jgi:hypothetical protein
VTSIQTFGPPFLSPFLPVFRRKMPTKKGDIVVKGAHGEDITVCKACYYNATRRSSCEKVAGFKHSDTDNCHPNEALRRTGNAEPLLGWDLLLSVNVFAGDPEIRAALGDNSGAQRPPPRLAVEAVPAAEVAAPAPAAACGKRGRNDELRPVDDQSVASVSTMQLETRGNRSPATPPRPPRAQPLG